MDNIIVGVIVLGALIFCLKKFIKIYRGQGGCNCSSGCSFKGKKGHCSQGKPLKIMDKNEAKIR
ncbi:MAG: FeoB-associated Cys-rich membrane protein [Desulfobacteraceae bacterium]|nr:FeoB-associated Cys-rich membrane protein [Desulfobacteraceae bacterium]